MNLTAYTYRLPFSQSLKNSQHTYRYREGIILYLETSERSYVGEAAPLPGFSSENLADIKAQTKKHIKIWHSLMGHAQPFQLLQNHYQQPIASSLQFALDTLASQLEAHRTGKSLQQLLFDQWNKKTPLNGLLSLSTNEVLSSVGKLKEEGFTTFKCKVGINFEEELTQLQKIGTHYPDFRIRLDANRAWSLPEAASCFEKLANLDIEYCEEPLAKSTPENYKELALQSSIPLALDESLNMHTKQWMELLPHISFLIVKPMVIGSFERIKKIYEQSIRSEKKIIFTSSLESSIGRTITSILASGWGAKDHAHGLNTGNMLEQDITANQPMIFNGSINSSDMDAVTVTNTHLETITTKIISST
ncbi:o-succinylbenzoate synthase [Aliifodinibius salicampi]|uniref:o-succinylbenzoate synthase n=1 Tax=Fodinibius salicampi TaxID=1920655 RepID=A0ABT3PW29_9BACT|nr:o-succinylbenzoate synthase [Fodinibius salicampi]MCW9712054.1 o-succinylbenzoate synthase [Fodinibius salicampi]